MNYNYREFLVKSENGWKDFFLYFIKNKILISNIEIKIEFENIKKILIDYSKKWASKIYILWLEKNIFDELLNLFDYVEEIWFKSLKIDKNLLFLIIIF